MQPQKEGAAFAGAVSERRGHGRFPLSGRAAGRVIHLIRNLGPRQMATGRERVRRLWFSREAVLSLCGQAGVSEALVASERTWKKV